MIHFRMIGDFHEDLHKYVLMTSQAEYSIQIGDLAIRCDALDELVDPKRHLVIGGNHDNYATLDNGQTFHNQPKNYVGDFGNIELPGVPKIFYVRGGRSVDRKRRQEGVDWWPDEELTYKNMNVALAEYTQEKPDFVITHECPAFLVDMVTRWKVPLSPSNTAQLLEAMWMVHKPKVWIFGHFHNDWTNDVDGTHFRCLDIRTTYDMDKPFTVDEIVPQGRITSLNLGGK